MTHDCPSMSYSPTQPLNASPCPISCLPCPIPCMTGKEFQSVPFLGPVAFLQSLLPRLSTTQAPLVVSVCFGILFHLGPTTYAQTQAFLPVTIPFRPLSQTSPHDVIPFCFCKNSESFFHNFGLIPFLASFSIYFSTTLSNSSSST